MSEAAIGRYERELGASLERLYENALDWEHLPYRHGTDFSAIKLLEEDATGWRAEARLADTREAIVELTLDRDAGRWVTTTSFGGAMASKIVTDAASTGPDSCRVAVAFFADGLPPSAYSSAGRYFETLYARLYDEDELLMQARAEALRLGAAVHGPRRDVTLSSGDTVRIPLACPHQGLPLDTEPDARGVVTCPWHGYRFDAVTGRNLDGKGCGWSV